MFYLLNALLWRLQHITGRGTFRKCQKTTFSALTLFFGFSPLSLCFGVMWTRRIDFFVFPWLREESGLLYLICSKIVHQVWLWKILIALSVPEKELHQGVYVASMSDSQPIMKRLITIGSNMYLLYIYDCSLRYMSFNP